MSHQSIQNKQRIRLPNSTIKFFLRSNFRTIATSDSNEEKPRHFLLLYSVFLVARLHASLNKFDKGKQYYLTIITTQTKVLRNANRSMSALALDVI